MIIIGRMAEKYHMLPHQIAEQATTFDFTVQDILHTYDEYQFKVKTGKDLNDMINTEDLKSFMEQVRAS